MRTTAGPTSVRLEQDDVDRIHRVASQQGIGQQTVIRLALRLGLAELEELLADRKILRDPRVRAAVDQLRQRDRGQTGKD